MASKKALYVLKTSVPSNGEVKRVTFKAKYSVSDRHAIGSIDCSENDFSISFRAKINGEAFKVKVSDDLKVTFKHKA